MAKKKVAGKSDAKVASNGAARKAAKKRPAKKKVEKQTQIEGTYDPIPSVVQAKADEYYETLRSRMEMQSEENLLRRETLELMKKHDIESVDLSEVKYLVIDHGDDKLAVKTKKGDLE